MLVFKSLNREQRNEVIKVLKEIISGDRDEGSGVCTNIKNKIPFDFNPVTLIRMATGSLFPIGFDRNLDSTERERLYYESQHDGTLWEDWQGESRIELCETLITFIEKYNNVRTTPVERKTNKRVNTSSKKNH